MTLDTASLAFTNNRYQAPRSAEEAAKAARDSGARILPSGPIDRTSKLYEQCQEFESIFMKMMLKEMRATVNKGDLLDGGHAEEIFEDMLYDEYAKGMTKTAGFGLADAVYRELSRQGAESVIGAGTSVQR